MKYSIRGNLHNTEGETVIPVLQSYTAWRLTMKQDWDENIFIFEIWLAEETNKTSLFEEIKPYVDEFTGFIDWHTCTHDQRYKKPCMIQEEYRR
ncbi:hypothetical protein AA0X95_04315 [Bacillus sp. 1P10SD]|uniref:hypothetical protein n=1 Tax=Bacillus sp. 1P10SD TaxID=3132265 RepID=UPI0039A60DE9